MTQLSVSVTGTVKIFDNQMNPIAEIEAKVSGDAQKRVFTIPVSDPNCKKEILSFWNYAQIGDETGIIFTPRTWFDGQVSSTVYIGKTSKDIVAE